MKRSNKRTKKRVTVTCIKGETITRMWLNQSIFLSALKKKTINIQLAGTSCEHKFIIYVTYKSTQFFVQNNENKYVYTTSTCQLHINASNFSVFSLALKQILNFKSFNIKINCVSALFFFVSGKYLVFTYFVLNLFNEKKKQFFHRLIGFNHCQQQISIRNRFFIGFVTSVSVCCCC